jgi:hypothetical protein
MSLYTIEHLFNKETKDYSHVKARWEVKSVTALTGEWRNVFYTENKFTFKHCPAVLVMERVGQQPIGEDHKAGDFELDIIRQTRAVFAVAAYGELQPYEIGEPSGELGVYIGTLPATGPEMGPACTELLDQAVELGAVDPPDTSGTNGHGLRSV